MGRNECGDDLRAPAQPNSPRPQLVPGCTLVGAVNDRCAKTGLDRYGKWQMAKPKCGQKSIQNRTKVDPKSNKINPKSVLELQISVMEPAPLAEPYWIDFGRTFVGLLAQAGAILKGKLGACWAAKLIFTGFGRRLNMNTKLKAFRD